MLRGWQQELLDSLCPTKSGLELDTSILTETVNVDQKPEIINVRFADAWPQKF